MHVDDTRALTLKLKCLSIYIFAMLSMWIKERQRRVATSRIIGRSDSFQHVQVSMNLWRGIKCEKSVIKLFNSTNSWISSPSWKPCQQTGQWGNKKVYYFIFNEGVFFFDFFSFHFTSLSLIHRRTQGKEKSRCDDLTTIRTEKRERKNGLHEQEIKERETEQQY